MLNSNLRLPRAPDRTLGQPPNTCQYEIVSAFGRQPILEVLGACEIEQRFGQGFQLIHW